MSLRSSALCSLLLSTIIIYNAAFILIGANETDATRLEDAPSSRLPPLLDYEHYKRLFNKHYGLLEALARRAYFIPRSLHVFTSALSFMFRRQDYHLSLNIMSDYLPEELKRMENHVDKSQAEADVLSELFGDSKQLDELDERLDSDSDSVWVNASDEELERRLDELTRDAPVARELLEADKDADKALERERRSTETPPGLRKLNLQNLISDGRRARATMQWPSWTSSLGNDTKTASNNDKYESLERGEKKKETAESSKRRVKMAQVKFGKVPTNGLYLIDYFYQRERKRIKKIIEQEMSGPCAADDEGRDIIYVDHSKSPCMDTPRDQGRCGACYAFAAVAMFEWLYCKKFGQLVPFSEQYILDCAKEYIEGAAGCIGGTYWAGAQFVQNFGLELAANYPYTQRDQECPIERQRADLKTTGYIRFDFERAVYVPVNLWEEYLHFGPLYVRVNLRDTNFRWYGGGVHTLACDIWSKRESLHAMILVGYGTQDGRKYWKMRNSDGVYWGEQGYYRVLQASSSCIKHEAVSFASKNGRDHLLDQMELNSKYQANSPKRPK